MPLAEWLAFASICFLGAVSPGPSLFVIVRAAVHGGRLTGVMTGLVHAVAVGLYAVGAILVLTGALAIGEPVLMLVQVVGIVWLLKLATGLWGADAKGMDISAAASIRDGFLIAFLNPKMLAFFLALFSPFVYPEMTLDRKITLVITPALIDGAWYAFAAFVFSVSAMRELLLARARMLNRVMAAVLASLALSLSWRLLS